MTNLFPLFLGLGLAAAMLWAVTTKGRQAAGSASLASNVVLLEAVVASSTAGLLVARLFYVILHWPLYAEAPWQGLWLWRGGLTGWAAVIGAALGLSGYAKLRRLDAWQLADLLIGPGLLVSFGLWLGCLSEGCAYGRRLAAPWGWPAPDLAGNVQPRWPTQAFGALSAAVMLIPLHRLLTTFRLRPGAVAGLGMAALALTNFGISLVRADPAPYWGLVRVQTLAWGLLTLTALILTFIRWRPTQ
jgi:prolipoprotein diacylglyceryltransferase